MMTLRRLVGLSSALIASALLPVAAEPVLTGTTSARQSLFVRGSEATMRLEAKGLQPAERRPLSIVLKDAYGRQVGEIENAGIIADAAGNWQGEFPLRTDLLGFWRVCVSSGELTLPKMGSRPAGCLTYAVLADWRDRPQLDERECFFGLQGGRFNQWVGAHWQYSASNPSPDLKASQAAERKRREAEFPVYGTLSMEYRFVEPFLSAEAKAYFQARKKDARMNFSFPEGDAAGERYFREGVAAFARAAKASRPGQRIYEICLECELISPDIETTLRCFKAAHAALHEADPEGMLFGACVSNVRGPALDYLRRLFDLGLAPYIDGFDIHPYTAYPPDRHGFVENIRSFVRLVRERKGQDVMMISTEQGFAAPFDQEVLQMEGNVRVALMLLGEGFSRHLAFWGYDFGNDHFDCFDGDYGLNYNLELKTNRWNGTTSPRPSLCALSAACLYLDGKRPVTPLEGLGETALGYAYADRDNRCVLALWDYGGEPREVIVPVGRPEIEVADVMGNKTRQPTKDGMLTLKLTGAPCYVLDPDPQLWGSAGTMRELIAREREAQRRKAEAARRAEVLSVLPTFESGETGVRVQVRNRLSDTNTFVVSSRIYGLPEARRAIEVTLPPHGESWVALGFGGMLSLNPSEKIPVEIEVAQADEYRLTQTEKLNFFCAEPLAEDVGVKGDFSSWQSPCRFRWPVENGEQDVRMALGWNERSLLVDLEVADDVFYNQKIGFDTWRGDSIQLGLAKAALTGTTGNYQTDILETALSEITLALTTNGPSAYRTITYDPVRFPSDVKGRGEIPSDQMPCQIQVTTNATGLVIRYQTAIPWEFLNITRPHSGLVFRLAAFANDNDGKTAMSRPTRWFELKESAPQGFAYVTLGAKTSPGESCSLHTRAAREIGQSQSPGTPPIEWTSCAWCVSDKDHNVYLPGGWRIRAGERTAEKCEDTVGGEMFSDGCGNIWSRRRETGEVFSVIVDEQGLHCGEKVFTTAKGVPMVVFAARPELTAGFGARARFGALVPYRGRIEGYDESGRRVGTLVDCNELGIKKVVSATFHPRTGELLVGTEWPDRHVHCIGADGKEISTGVWPYPALALGINAVGTNVYFCGGVAERLGNSLMASKRFTFGQYALEARMLADGGDGWWLATTQGAQHYLKTNPTVCDRRIGGVAQADRLGLRDGKILVAAGKRLMSFWLDATADETPCCTERPRVDEKTFPKGLSAETDKWRVEFDDTRKAIRVVPK